MSCFFFFSVFIVMYYLLSCICCHAYLLSGVAPRVNEKQQLMILFPVFAISSHAQVPPQVPSDHPSPSRDLRIDLHSTLLLMARRHRPHHRSNPLPGICGAVLFGKEHRHDSSSPCRRGSYHMSLMSPVMVDYICWVYPNNYL